MKLVIRMGDHQAMQLSSGTGLQKTESNARPQVALAVDQPRWSGYSGFLNMFAKYIQRARHIWISQKGGVGGHHDPV